MCAVGLGSGQELRTSIEGRIKAPLYPLVIFLALLFLSQSRW
jgi:hypothetical protein